MDKNNWKCIVQIESTTHFHPQLASKAEKVFPIPLNRKTLMELIVQPYMCIWSNLKYLFKINTLYFINE